MKDRWGASIRVGFGPTEEEWIRAANTLDGPERASAFRDIASMSGRSFGQVQAKANDMRRQDAEKRYLEWRLSGPVLTARSHLGRKPSDIAPASKAALMGSKALCRYSRDKAGHDHPPAATEVL